MTEQELEFWKQVYVACVSNGDTHHDAIGKFADNAVQVLRLREREMIKTIEPML